MWGIKYPILNKLRPGNRCRYIGKSEVDKKFGFKYGKEYVVIDRLPRVVVFSTPAYEGALDFGLYDGGDYFFECWEIINSKIIMDTPDIDFDNEENHIYWDLIKINSKLG
ncbi:hypothetical protein [uncultured Clostridium sp.]|uniref:hypothetical protein n=1 Tax=uncultured Clostridium sp. TaxID=59620 RepID=UPI002613FC93|nr:hypothetical protein [uncultured Clostridium sp.]